MEEISKKFSCNEIELVQIQSFDGYEVENPTWTFHHYAIVRNRDCYKVDIVDGKTYVSIDYDKKRQFYQRENLQVGDVRAVTSPINQVFQASLKTSGNTFSDIANFICESGLYFPYGRPGKHDTGALQLCQIVAYQKSLKG